MDVVWVSGLMTALNLVCLYVTWIYTATTLSQLQKLLNWSIRYLHGLTTVTVLAHRILESESAISAFQLIIYIRIVSVTSGRISNTGFFFFFYLGQQASRIQVRAQAPLPISCPELLQQLPNPQQDNSDSIIWGLVPRADPLWLQHINTLPPTKHIKIWIVG